MSRKDRRGQIETPDIIVAVVPQNCRYQGEGALALKSSEVARLLRLWVERDYARIRWLKESEAVLGVSYSYASHCFRREFHISVEQYLLLVRIRRTKELLRGTNLPIIDVIARVGARDDVHFRKKFREQEGYSMSEYRRNHQEKQRDLQAERDTVKASLSDRPAREPERREKKDRLGGQR